VENDKKLPDDYNYGDRLIESLEQALAYAKGDKSKARVTIRETPVPEYKAGDVSRVRSELRLSQRALAGVLGVSARTVEAWEAGRNAPNGPAARMLYLIEADHSLVEKLVIR
jgi:putative transcriptional regulator